MGYLDSFKSIVKDNYGNGRKFCEVHEINYGYYRKATRSGRKGCPRWVEMFVIGFELRDGFGCDCEKNIVEPTADYCKGGCVGQIGDRCVICCEVITLVDKSSCSK